ncbi:HEPN domain-containing protein [Dolichospermum sp. ST_con]|nr:HEPN domain-containing protein [Dolichospermum sp. ST_con]MDD1417994.1 HEPN domain-containing protein [Dolichospermum sp. ST_sed1]MDD1426813.1 HEPN domain-containing protein [Dolichospermum sp. ST_sed9]MDD1434295.1 HEPN domain-containing protein [Dolichospermum sp. ST_sed6]MDD1436534.1 HEPN domain-containing protein [Dolichospermum sp. ST_sed10]MDD1439003.1 HEPN domain-containing protein [Dolichospermum sp. ST_sed3]MDD1448377.1 HEPN domain-containing protein [Dolichospermum sp. ST_sed8]MD
MNDEQKYLLIKAERSLNAAKELNSKNYPEFATSRAYYAMFYIAEALLLNENLSFSSHAAVISALGKYLVKTNKIPIRYHRYLIDAQDQRNRGDYDVNPNLTKEDADKLIVQAEEILDFANQYLS